MEKLIEVKGLKTYFYTEDGVVKAVDDVSFSIEKGKTLGIVGESGSGKSITSLSIMRLVQSPPGKIVGGEVLFHGRDLLKLPISEMRQVRGNDIAMIFQEPMTSLNPVFTIGRQIAEAVILHQKTDKKTAWEKAVQMLSLVGIPNPEKRVKEYPHQLSGGMRQRVMIAMALSCSPELLICDEPTTALDVTIQAQILDLINALKQETGAAIIMITHALGVIAEVADDVIVMYCGKIVEHAEVHALFKNPLHPYTEGLLQSIPKLNQSDDVKLQSIPGMVPKMTQMPEGCPFHPRCKYAKEICTKRQPENLEVDGHIVRCLKYDPECSELWKEGAR